MSLVCFTRCCEACKLCCMESYQAHTHTRALASVLSEEDARRAARTFASNITKAGTKVGAGDKAISCVEHRGATNRGSIGVRACVRGQPPERSPQLITLLPTQVSVKKTVIHNVVGRCAVTKSERDCVVWMCVIPDSCLICLLV